MADEPDEGFIDEKSSKEYLLLEELLENSGSRWINYFENDLMAFLSDGEDEKWKNLEKSENVKSFMVILVSFEWTSVKWICWDDLQMPFKWSFIDELLLKRDIFSTKKFKGGALNETLEDFYDNNEFQEYQNEIAKVVNERKRLKMSQRSDSFYTEKTREWSAWTASMSKFHAISVLMSSSSKITFPEDQTNSQQTVEIIDPSAENATPDIDQPAEADLEGEEDVSIISDISDALREEDISIISDISDAINDQEIYEDCSLPPAFIKREERPSTSYHPEMQSLPVLSPPRIIKTPPTVSKFWAERQQNVPWESSGDFLTTTTPGQKKLKKLPSKRHSKSAAERQLPSDDESNSSRSGSMANLLKIETKLPHLPKLKYKVFPEPEAFPSQNDISADVNSERRGIHHKIKIKRPQQKPGGKSRRKGLRKAVAIWLPLLRNVVKGRVRFKENSKKVAPEDLEEKQQENTAEEECLASNSKSSLECFKSSEQLAFYNSRDSLLHSKDSLNHAISKRRRSPWMRFLKQWNISWKFTTMQNRQLKSNNRVRPKTRIRRPKLFSE